MSKEKVTKQRIVDTAILIAEKNGLTELTLKAVAAHLSIKVPSLYNHISGLDELFDLLALEGLQQLHSEILNSIVGLSGKTALRSMGIAYYGFACKSPILYETSQQPAFWKSQKTKNVSHDITDLCLQILATSNQSNEEKINIIRALRGYLHGFSTLVLQGSFQLPIGTDASFQFGFNALLEGLTLDC
ncbi:TetR/AcrR family transcriptional regulator [Enterococcus sp. LJL99]